MVNLAAYLGRLRYTGPTAPTPETLRALHLAHLYAVPFENLDIGLHRLIACDVSAAVRKVVELKRGGFCYELNSAFGALLQRLGFKVTMLSARVARRDGSSSPEFDHLTLRVDLKEPWLADVGFGESFLEPLLLQPEIVQEQHGRQFRLMPEGTSIRMERAEPDGSWLRQYSFTEIPRRLDEFAEMCRFHQTSPDSHFTQNRICTRATPDGRITLSGRKLIVTKSGVRTENDLGTEENWLAALKEHFGVVL
ncbi:MAG TPA: arylamine N-acetyltransferase [Terriglobales bacterium]|jgi:N-hydroxyarylamine O-acetyltransferase